MGRIVNALMIGDQDAERIRLDTPAEPPVVCSVETLAVDAKEIPYIEVGGSGPTLDASPQVLAFPARAKAGQANGSLPTGVSQPTSGTPQKPPYAVASHSPRIAFHAVHATSPRLASARERFASSLIAFHQPGHPVAQAYQALLENMIAAVHGEGPLTMLLASPRAGTGVTTVLLNLALTEARLGRERVVVVDANLRRPAIARSLGLAGSPGLRDVIGRTATLLQALRESGQPGCWCLPSGEPIPPGNPWPAGDALRAVLFQLRSRFDRIFIDAPSWDTGAELAALGSACDAVFLVVGPNQIETPATRDISRLIPQLTSQFGGYIVTERR